MQLFSLGSVLFIKKRRSNFFHVFADHFLATLGRVAFLFKEFLVYLRIGFIYKNSQ
jgi:hypothetical protein